MPRLFRCAIAVSLAFAGLQLVVASADSSPSPAPVLTLSDVSGTTGDKLTLDGSGFPPGEIVALYIDKPVTWLPYNLPEPPGPRADGQGNIHVTFTWPGDSYSTAVNPTKPGTHQVCGDTEADPNAPQKVAAKACANFVVNAPPAAAQNSVGGAASGASLPEILIALAIFAVVAVAAGLWVRSLR